MSKAKPIIDTIVTSILAEVTGADTWNIHKFDPVALDVIEEPALFVYCRRRRPTSITGPGGFRTTQTREDTFEIVIEYVEPAPIQPQDFTREEAAELAVQDIADTLVDDWADSHELWPGVAHAFDWIETVYPSDVRRQLQVRHFQLVLHARLNAIYE